MLRSILTACVSSALFLALSTFWPAEGEAQNRLPNCPKITFRQWDNCFGKSKDGFQGEFKNGRQNGIGIYEFESSIEITNNLGRYPGVQFKIYIYGGKFSFSAGNLDNNIAYYRNINYEFIEYFVELLSVYWPEKYRLVKSLLEQKRCFSEERVVQKTVPVPRPATPVAPTVKTAPVAPAPAPPSNRSTEEGIVVEVSNKTVGGVSIAVIKIDGELQPGDEKKFNRALLTVGDKVPIVFFNSLGGDLNAGIQIGETIWTNELATAVTNNSQCASACALAWLAGRPRFAEPGVGIGFHAPTRVDDPDRRADSAASAITGGYLSKLGFKSSAIAYMTEMQPNEMRWLTPEDADRLGISYLEWGN